MPSSRSFPRASAAVATLTAFVAVVAGVLAAPAAADVAQQRGKQAEDATPLAVTIESLTPGTVSERGPVLVRGLVTNVDEEPWQDVAVYPFVGGTPLTAAADLAASVEAADLDPEAPVGERIQEPGTFTTIPLINPGASVGFELRVPRRVLMDEIARQHAAGVAEPGVYWFGVHALGSGPNGRDVSADGRARTLLPLIGRQMVRRAAADPVDAAVVVPVRARIFRDHDGRLANTAGWVGLLSPDGRLGRLLALGSAPDGDRLSWLVDPAVLDAVRQLAAGNPGRFLGPTDDAADEAADDQEGETPAPEASASPSPTATAEPEPDPATVTAAALATSWLAGMQRVLSTSDVLALPYGDLDLAATATHAPALYETARARSATVFEELGIDATPVNAPASGWITTEALDMVEPAVPVLLSDEALEEDAADETTTGAPPVTATAQQRRLLLSATTAAQGGPTPGDPLAGVPLRQRLLAEAAVRLLDPDRPPLLVTLPSRWRADAALADDLEQPWLRFDGLAAVEAAAVGPTETALAYPAQEQAAELDRGSFVAAEQLMAAGTTLQRVLARNDQVAREVTGEALATLSYLARGADADPAATSRQSILATLRDVEVQGPAAVTLSSSSGRFAATVVNGLPEPITVQIRPVTGDGITVDVPTDVEVAGGARATVVLSAEAQRAGLHNVYLRLTDAEGIALGGATRVPIRAAQVSGIIWLFLGVGAALLFGAIGVRLFRRIRAARRTPRPEAAEAAPRPDSSTLTGAP